MRTHKAKWVILTWSALLPFTSFAQGRNADAGGNSVAASRQHTPIGQNSSLFGARLGLVDVEQIDGVTLGVGGTYEYAIADNLLAGLSLDYWQDSYNVTADRKADVSDVAFGAQTKMVFSQLNLPVRPFGLVGLAAHRLRVKESSILSAQETGASVDRTANPAVDTKVKFGVDLGGGIVYGINREIDVTAEVRWRNVLQETAAYDQLAFAGGITYLL